MKEARHRLLEGVLLRLARLPDGGGLVLRGGMLLRHWFRPLSRPTPDLDLVAPTPAAAEEARRHLTLFSDDAIGDGVSFDTGHIHVERIWVHTENPGLRVHVRGSVDGCNRLLKIDITGGPPSRPRPVIEEIPALCGKLARVWACPAEAVVGQKFQALCHLGMLGWRPKDLDDLRLLLERVPMDAAALREGVEAYMSDMGWSVDEARAALADASWWGSKHASARWSDHVESTRGRTVPGNLATVVADIAIGLATIWRQTP